MSAEGLPSRTGFLGSIRAGSIVTDRRVHEVKNKESTGGSFPNEKSVDRLIDGTSVKKCSKGDREGLGEAFLHLSPFVVTFLTKIPPNQDC